MSIATTASQRPRRAFACALGKLQLVAVAATAFDHAIMIVTVRTAAISPAAATAFGALGGALLAFALGRGWVFAAARQAIAPQAARYGVTALASLLLNVAGEYLLVRAGVHYIIARAGVALIVGVAWNFPMQRYFVFAPRGDDLAVRRPPALT